MAKLLNLLLLVMAMEIALVIFGGQVVPGSALMDFLFNPTDWHSTSLISWLETALAIGGLGAAIIGSIWMKSDFLVFAGITAVFFSFGIPFYTFFQYIASKGVFGGTALSPSWIAKIFISPLILMYVYVILEFLRGKD